MLPTSTGRPGVQLGALAEGLALAEGRRWRWSGGIERGQLGALAEGLALAESRRGEVG